MRPARTLIISIVAFLLSLPALAAAQEPVTSFGQLNTRLRPGDTIWVTDAQGREVKGRILSLSTDALALEDGRGGSIGAADVSAIQVRRADSLGNGALIGLGVAGGLSLAACLASANSDEMGLCMAAAVVYAGIGAGIGVGIDALIPGKKLVAYRAPGPASASHARLSIAPVVTPRTKGVALSFAF